VSLKVACPHCGGEISIVEVVLRRLYYDNAWALNDEGVLYPLGDPVGDKVFWDTSEMVAELPYECAACVVQFTQDQLEMTIVEDEE
jgi:DNA-directed RNA polymerase subunit RPC12/RpoP